MDNLILKTSAMNSLVSLTVAMLGPESLKLKIETDVLYTAGFRVIYGF